MTFTEWVEQRYGSAASGVPNMRQLEAWEAGRQDLKTEIQPIRVLATELALVLQKAFSGDDWIGVPEALAEARARGLLKSPEGGEQHERQSHLARGG
jgi:hypothetical protein